MAHRLAHQRDLLPVGRRPVAVQLGAGVHHQLGRRRRRRWPARCRAVARCRGCPGASWPRPASPPAPRGAPRATMSCTSSGSSSSTAPPRWRFTVLRRAAEVQVDACGPQRRQARRVVGQAGRVAAEQLRPHRRAGRGAAAVEQLGHDAREHALGQQLVGDADELRDAAIDAADARDHVAQAVVQQALHRGEQDPQRPRRNSASSSFSVTWRQVGRPWLHWSARSVRFHVAQQRVHLVQRQPAVGAHRAVAGHRRQQLVARALHHAAGVDLRQFGQHRARQLGQVGVGQRRRAGCAPPACRPTAAPRPGPARSSASACGLGGGASRRRGGEGGRDQQRLRLACAAPPSAAFSRS